MANERVALKKGKPIKDETVILVNNQVFDGWKTVSINKNLESISNSFQIELFDRFVGLRTQWPFRPGVSIKININKERVFTGRIEKVDVDYSPSSRSFSISGRSLPGDLVECGHTGDAEFNDITLTDLATELIKPFGLRVFESVKTEKIAKFSVKPGESIFEALDRAARLQGFFFISTRGGNIRITRAARARASTVLEQDVNILSANASYDDSDRHNEYTVKGQTSGVPTFNGAQAAQAEGKAFDRSITRHRPLIMIAESNADSAQAEKRAQWEAAVRLGKSIRVGVTVQGWTQQDGKLWGINQVTRVKSSFLGLNRDLLITSLEHSDGAEQSRQTRLTLTDKNAFIPEPEKNKKASDDLIKQLQGTRGVTL